MNEEITTGQGGFLKSQLLFGGEGDLTEKNIYERLSRLSLVLILTLILVISGLLVLKEFVSPGLKKKMSKWDKLLRGFESLNVLRLIKKPPTFEPKRVISGEWQKEFEIWLGRNLPFRSYLIELHNEIYYRFFSKSYMAHGSLVIGKNKVLYQQGYINKYYNLDYQSLDQKGFDNWAEDLKKFGNFFKSRGQTFVYIISPSKPAYFPEYLPKCNRCKKLPVRPEYYKAVNTLQKHGIKYIDGSKLILSRKHEYGTYLFPKGGVHWTLLGAVMATQEIMREINLTHPLPELNYSYTIKNTAEGLDMDLLALANLRMTSKNYPVPDVTIHPLSPQSKKPLKIAMVGCSFSFDILTALARTKLFDQIDFYYYAILDRYHYTKTKEVQPGLIPGTRMPFVPLGLNPEAPQAYDALMNADIVILEENEQNLRSNHFKYLLTKLNGRKPVGY